jgi:mRNA interferase RelE/StbE
LKVVFRKSFLRDVRTIRDQSLLNRIKEAIADVAQVQKPTEIPNLKKLKGEGQYYRIRIGGHRVGLKIEADTVTFVRILNQKEIYRYFP